MLPPTGKYMIIQEIKTFPIVTVDNDWKHKVDSYTDKHDISKILITNSLYLVSTDFRPKLLIFFISSYYINWISK